MKNTSAFSLQRTVSVARKELLHIIRDPMTLFFSLFVPILEMFMLGFAIDTNVRHIRTIVLDQAQTQESRELLRSFVNSEDFDIVDVVYREKDLTDAIVAGRARVGIKIPEDYSRTLLAGGKAQVLVLVDGSESSIAGEAVNVSNALTLRETLKRMLLDNRSGGVEARPRLLFNPDTRSANFFLPGLLVVMCQMMAVMLTANAIVREKETGTLEQLFMTPVKSGELMLGKLAPYLVLTFAEFGAILFLMRTVFQVPIRGSIFTLLALALPFILGMLGLGLYISTRASTRDASLQMSMATVMPSIFLSGYVFPVDSMPAFFRGVAQFIPTTWMIDAARGVILRGAGWRELQTHALILWCMALAVLLFSMLRFRKRLA